MKRYGGPLEDTRWRKRGLVIYETELTESASTAFPITIPHGRASIPKLRTVAIRCLVAEEGFAVGDEQTWSTEDGNGARAKAVTWNDTDVVISASASFATIGTSRKDTGAVVGLTPANWEFVVRMFLD